MRVEEPAGWCLGGRESGCGGGLGGGGGGDGGGVSLCGGGAALRPQQHHRGSGKGPEDPVVGGEIQASNKAASPKSLEPETDEVEVLFNTVWSVVSNVVEKLFVLGLRVAC